MEGILDTVESSGVQTLQTENPVLNRNSTRDPKA